MKYLVVFTLFFSIQIRAQLGESSERRAKPQNIFELSFGQPILELTQTLISIEDIIFSTLDNRFSYKVPFKEPILNHRWLSLGGKFKDIALDEKGNLFALDENNLLYKLLEDHWVYQGIKGKKISGGIGKGLCLIGLADGGFYLKNGKWTKIKGKLASFLSLGDDKFLGIEQKSIGRLSLYEEGTWLDLPGINLKMMSALSESNIYALRDDYSVWNFDGIRWKKLVGKMKNITVVTDEILIGIGLNDGVYQYSDGSWVPMRGNSLLKIVAINDHQFYAISLSGEIWKSFLPQIQL
ncbi:MAG: hypothetical protein OEY33_05900 [Bdellovibrionales bacterium]|jgi:hypothetical protein|nr:hypothetical protein [Bdellovibrionales bacterium]